MWKSEVLDSPVTSSVILTSPAVTMIIIKIRRFSREGDRKEISVRVVETDTYPWSTSMIVRK